MARAARQRFEAERAGAGDVFDVEHEIRVRAQRSLALGAFERPRFGFGSSALLRLSRSHRTRTADTWPVSSADR